MKEVRSFIKTASLTDLEKAQQLINDAISKYTQQQKAKQEVDKRTKVKPKYRMELNGETIEWTGRGRRPKAFEGVELEKFLA